MPSTKKLCDNYLTTLIKQLPDYTNQTFRSTELSDDQKHSYMSVLATDNKFWSETIS